MSKQKVVGFGEIMGRFAPEGFLRLRQVVPGGLNLSFGGAEANVCSSLAMLGGRSCLVTALPDNPLGAACIAFLRSLDVDVSHIVKVANSRLGLYFIEAGANQRPSNVVYDRAGAAIATTPSDQYDWDGVLEDAGWLHVSGITPALSKTAAEATRQAVAKANQHGVTVSCDLNFRKKLWSWDDRLKPRELAEKTMREILPGVQVLIANEEDADDVLGIQAGTTDLDSGRLDIDRYPEVAKQIAEQFPQLKKIAITLRESVSASHNNWGAMLYDVASGEICFAPLDNHQQYTPYQIRNIVDRVGGGDSFAAGLIYALMDEQLQAPATAIAFAAAASCLAHSIYGDVNYSSRAEVEALMGGSVSGRVKR